MKNPLSSKDLNHALAQSINPTSRIGMDGVQWAMDLFGIKPFRYDKDHTIGWHSHEDCHLEIVLSGRFHFWSESGERTVDAMQVLFIPPGVSHRWTCVEPGVMIGQIMFLEGSRRQEMLGFLQTAIPTGLMRVSSPDLKVILNEILWEGISGKPFGRYLLGQQFFMLACKTLREIPGIDNWEASSRKHVGGHSPKEEVVSTIKSYIGEHLAEPLSLEKIAEHCHIGVRHLNRVFCEVERNTPHKYLLKQRLNRARGLILKNPHTPIKSVAHESGFTTNTSYFSRQFKRQYGALPTAFRDRILAKR